MRGRRGEEGEGKKGGERKMKGEGSRETARLGNLMEYELPACAARTGEGKGEDRSGVRECTSPLHPGRSLSADRKQQGARQVETAHPGHGAWPPCNMEQSP